jgi:hypothetical protein
MKEVFPFALKSRRSIWHDAFTLRCSDLAAEIRLAGGAEFTFTALRRAEVYV